MTSSNKRKRLTNSSSITSETQQNATVNTVSDRKVMSVGLKRSKDSCNSLHNSSSDATMCVADHDQNRIYGNKHVKDNHINEHPFNIGSHVVVRYRDGSNRLAKIVETSSNATTQLTRNIQYYIHYLDFNRRMDEWIPPSRIVQYPSEADVIAEDREKKSKDVETINKMVDENNNLTDDAVIISTTMELEHDEHEGMDELSLLEHEEVTKIKNIKYVKIGKYVMECWYFSPFPKEFYPNGYTECLYFCEFTMRFFSTKDELSRYQRKTALPRHPPGNEIYRDNDLSMFELDGAVEKVYCQNLCYFAKLFLDHKTLYWDVDPFLFYVLCTQDDRGYHPVGYFSKEKYSDLGYNLACILTFPCVQRMGYGRFLISFSYELSKKEEKAGSPEKPLSDLGYFGYRSYWAHTLLSVLKENIPLSPTSPSSHAASVTISLMDLTKITSILPEDVMSTLQMLGLLHYDDQDTTIATDGKQSILPADVVNDCENGMKSVCTANNLGTDHLNLDTISSSSAVNVIQEGNQQKHREDGSEDMSKYRCWLYAPVEVLEELLLKYPPNKINFVPDKLRWAPLYVTDPKKDKWSIKSMLLSASTS